MRVTGEVLNPYTSTDETIPVFKSRNSVRNKFGYSIFPTMDWSEGSNFENLADAINFVFQHYEGNIPTLEGFLVTIVRWSGEDLNGNVCKEEVANVLFDDCNLKVEINPKAGDVRIGKVELDSGKRIPSVNAEYIPIRLKGSRGVRKTLSSNGRKFKDAVKLQLEGGEIHALRFLDKNNKCIQIDLTFEFSKFWGKRDVTNMIKLTEDALSDSIGHNDSWNVIVNVKKYEIGKEEEECIYCKVTIMNLDRR